MSELPIGWVEAMLDNLVELNPRHPDHSDLSTTVSFVPMPAVNAESGQIQSPGTRPLSDVWKGFTHFANGDVIFAKITPCMENGKIAVARNLANGLACGSTEFHVLRSNGAVLPDYIWSYLRQSSFREDAEASMTGAVGQRRVPTSYLRESVLPLPPLAEQRRIVAKLDALTARTARARTDLDRIPALAARYKQVLLSMAFQGELTREWRTKHNLAVSNRLMPLKTFCRSLTDGDHQAPPKAASGIPFITISAINDGQLRLEKASRYVPRSYVDSLKNSRVPKRGDVLYSVTGSYGITALVKGDQEFVFQRHIAILKPDPSRTTGEFLTLILAAPEVVEQASAVATGTAQLTVPLSGLREFQIPDMELDEQQEVIHLVGRAFAKIDRLTAEATYARRLLDRLDQSILAKAFRGEMVPQDPTDEPASELLARIKADRQTAPKASRGRKPKAP